MQLLSRKDLNSAELETVRESRNPTTVLTASGEVEANEEAAVYVKDFDVFLTGQIVATTTEIPMSGPVVKNHILSKTVRNTMQHGECCALRCSRLVKRTFQLVCE